MFQTKKRKPKLRYDRIILFVVIPVILIVTVITLIIDNSEKKPEPDNTVKPFVPSVYLSPSNQKENDYSDGGVTEADVMRTVSTAAAEYLENHGVKVFIADSKATLKEKVEFSNTHNLTAHVAIHSATGNGIKNLGGTTCFYNSGTEGSRELSEYIYSRVSGLTPTDDHGLSDGTQGATYMYEVAETRTPVCMVDVEYHDSIGNARWIIENTDDIGKAVAEGIMKYVEAAEKRYYQKNTESGEAENGEQDQLSEGT